MTFEEYLDGQGILADESTSGPLIRLEDAGKIAGLQLAHEIHEAQCAGRTTCAPSKTMKQEVEEFKRAKLARVLELISVDERATFDRIFPDGVPEGDVYRAYDLCERALRDAQS